jgi:hypothetical protein
MKDEADRKGDRSGGWIYGIFGFLFVGVFRAALAVVLIPLHAVVTLCQPDQTRPQTVTRIITLCVMAAGFGALFYTAQHASTEAQFQPSPTAGPVRQSINDGSVLPLQTANTQSHVPQPSFNCATARTPVEKLICRDADLAVIESGMASEYRRALQQQSADHTAAFRRKHLEWFKQYSRACNTQMSDAERKDCAIRYLTARTRQLQN